MNTANKRNCRKCSLHIPNKIYIDGKVKSLQNRKFCLTCSPYRQHNTHSTDPGIKGRRNGNGYRPKTFFYSYKRALDLKIALIHRAGGKCQRCGYNKSIRALCFHHRDPATKLFGLSLNLLWSKSKVLIETEFAKCDLLCANCHMEYEHAQSKTIAKINKHFGTTY